MAYLFPDYTIGALYVLSSPYAVPALVQGMDIPGAILTGFSLTSETRHMVDYALTGTPYIYIYGPRLTRLRLSGISTQKLNCANVSGVWNLLYNGALYGNPYYGSPIATISIDNVIFRGILVQHVLEATPSLPNMTSFAFEFIGIYFV